MQREEEQQKERRTKCIPKGKLCSVVVKLFYNLSEKRKNPNSNSFCTN